MIGEALGRRLGSHQTAKAIAVPNGGIYQAVNILRNKSFLIILMKTVSNFFLHKMKSFQDQFRVKHA